VPDSRHDPSWQPGRDNETGALPNLPDVTAGQPPAADRATAALLRSAVPEEQRPTHPVVRILQPATYPAVGQSAEMPAPRSAAVRLSDGESEIFGGFFARERHKGGRWRFYVACTHSAWQCCKINKDRDVRFTRTHVCLAVFSFYNLRFYER